MSTYSRFAVRSLLPKLAILPVVVVALQAASASGRSARLHAEVSGIPGSAWTDVCFALEQGAPDGLGGGPDEIAAIDWCLSFDDPRVDVDCSLHPAADPGSRPAPASRLPASAAGSAQAPTRASRPGPAAITPGVASCSSRPTDCQVRGTARGAGVPSRPLAAGTLACTTLRLASDGPAVREVVPRLTVLAASDVRGTPAFVSPVVASAVPVAPCSPPGSCPPVANQGGDGPGPVVDLADGVPARPGDLATMPLLFAQGQPDGAAGGPDDVTAASVCVDFDPDRLHLDPTDADLDGIPESVHFTLPPTHTGFVRVDDLPGCRLLISAIDLALPLSLLPEDSLAEIDLTVDPGALAGETLPVDCGDPDVLSFSDTLGTSVAGSCMPGSFAVGCADDASCDDSLFCNGAEICGPGGECLAGRPPALDDGVACTVDVCDEIDDTVAHLPDDGLCGDGQTCDPQQGCVAQDACPGPPPFTICHRPPGNPDRAHTITVGSMQAVEAHLRNHDDSCGPCP